MKYYSEDDVMDLLEEARDCERAYEWGEGHKRIHFEDYNPIEIPDKHGRCIEGDELADVLVQNLEPMLATRGISGLQADVIREVVDAIATMLRECPTVLEAST